MNDPTIDLVAAVLFGVAVLHTFAAKLFERLATRYPRHSGLFHLLGEVEVVFGFWAIVLVLLMALIGNGFNILNVDPFFKDLTTGVIIVLAVALAASGGNRR